MWHQDTSGMIQISRLFSLRVEGSWFITIKVVGVAGIMEMLSGDLRVSL